MNMKKTVSLLSGLVLAVSLPVASALADSATVTAAKSANVRAEASAKAAVVGWAMKGDTVEVLGVDGQWTRVQLKSGKTGYIHSSFLKKDGAAPAQTGVAATVSAAKSANVRAEANAKAKVVGWAMKGEQVTVLGTNGKWSQVRLKNGKTGYIHSSLLGGAAAGQTATIIAPKSANIRAEASAKAKIIGWAMKGDRFPLLEKSGKWVKVQLKNGKTGYIHAAYCAG